MPDFTSLMKLETEVVKVDGQEFTLTSLVSADELECKRLVKQRKVSKDNAETWLTWKALSKAHPEVTWEMFNSPDVPTKYKLAFTTAMMKMNGMVEAFRDLNGTPGDEDDFED